MIKLLCFTGEFFPPTTGGEQALFNAYRVLQDQVELHIFSLNSSDKFKDEEGLKQALPKAHIFGYNDAKRDKYSNIEAIARKIRSFLQRLAGVSGINKYRHLDLNIRLERNQPMLKVLNQYIEEHYIDIVQFEFISSIFYSLGIINESVKKVFVHHELQYIVNQSRLSQNPSLDESLYYTINKNRELTMLENYDAIITLSHDDTLRLKKDGVKTPIFTSFAQITPKNCEVKAASEMNDLVFVGPETHLPNYNGMMWFLEEVWPKILNHNPDINLNIIGKWDKATQKQMLERYPNLIFHGFVDNLGSAISNHVMIVPIREGSGIRMKILEAAQHFVPVVSCTVGAEGMGLASGKNCFITDNPDEFAQHIIYLLSHTDFAKKMAQQALDHFSEAYSDDKFIESRMACYNEITNTLNNNKRL